MVHLRGDGPGLALGRTSHGRGVGVGLVHDDTRVLLGLAYESLHLVGLLLELVLDSGHVQVEVLGADEGLVESGRELDVKELERQDLDVHRAELGLHVEEHLRLDGGTVVEDLERAKHGEGIADLILCDQHEGGLVILTPVRVNFIDVCQVGGELVLEADLDVGEERVVRAADDRALRDVRGGRRLELIPELYRPHLLVELDELASGA